MWLLERNFERELRAKLKVAGTASAEQLSRFSAHVDASVGAVDSPRGLKVAGDVAEISVKGVLTKSMDFWLWLFGYEQTTYDQINAGLATAAADPSVKRIVLYIDSPGGQVDGLFETFAALDAFPKPKSVRANLAASAAYGIASLGGKIEATNPAATFGSVGVVATYLVDEELVEITSTEAPDKRPDLSSEEGKAVIREYLDALHELFAEAIARGRGTTTADVNENFGRGAVFVAATAKKRGMIDKAPPSLRAVPKAAQAAYDQMVAEGMVTQDRAIRSDSQNSGDEPAQPAAPVAAQSQGQKTMDLQTLKAQHPDVYAAAFTEGKNKGFADGTEEGREAGVTAERKRVTAHLKMADTTGASDVAFKAIREGASVLDEDIHAEYMSAAMNRHDQNVRQEETDAAGDAVEGAAASGGESKDLGDEVAALMAAKRGKTL